MRWRSLRIGLVVVFVLALLAVLLFVPTRPLAGSRIQITTYFRDAQNLRANAPVRLAGVEVGRVASVRVRPEMREAPAEIVLAIRTPYELRIPQDATVTVGQAGVLGEPFAEIDVSNATAPPVPEHGAVLKSRESPTLTTEELVEKFGKILERPCGAEAKQSDKSQPEAASPQKPQTTP